MENISVLKLDSAFKPIEVISWQEAFVLTWLNKAWAVEYSDKWVRSAKEKFQIPLVIALFRHIDENFFTLPCTKRNIAIRDEYRCQYCEKVFPKDKLTVDHVRPRSKGGKTEWINVVTACIDCNQKKSDYLLPDAPVSLRKKPRAPSYRTFVKKRIKHANPIWSRYL